MKYPCISFWNGMNAIILWRDQIQCIENTQNKRFLGFFKLSGPQYGNGCYEQYWPNTTMGHQTIRQQWAEFNLATDTEINFMLLNFYIIAMGFSLTIEQGISYTTF